MQSNNEERKAGWVFILKDKLEKEHTAWAHHWKKRWMVISSTMISISPKENKERQTRIACDIIQNVRALADVKSRQHVFRVGTKLTTYVISVASEEDRRSWISAIQSIMEGRKNISFSSASGFGLSLIGSALVSTFEKIKVIGTGGFSTVYLVKRQGTNKYYAMKVIREGDMKQKNMEQEIRIMARINNPFLVKLQVSFKTQKYLYFVMDFINGGGLYYYLEKEETLDENRSKFYTAEIVCALEYLHSRGIIYRDLKPENIMISHSGHIVLTDFGLSKTGLNQKDARTTTRCGTPYYVSPEIILGEEYTKAVDFWSLGVVLYEMLFGIPPFYSEDAINIYKKIVTNDYSIDSDQITEVCKDFIESLLAEDPHQRLSEVERIKAHPFFDCYDWEKLKRQEITPPFIPPVNGPDDTQFFDSEVLASPIEHDDTEVSEYSDWSTLQELVGGNGGILTSSKGAQRAALVRGSFSSVESLGGGGGGVPSSKDSLVGSSISETNAQSDCDD